LHTCRTGPATLLNHALCTGICRTCMCTHRTHMHNIAKQAIALCTGVCRICMAWMRKQSFIIKACHMPCTVVGCHLLCPGSCLARGAVLQLFVQTYHRLFSAFWHFYNQCLINSFLQVIWLECESKVSFLLLARAPPKKLTRFWVTSLANLSSHEGSRLSAYLILRYEPCQATPSRAVALLASSHVRNSIKAKCLPYRREEEPITVF